MDSDAWLRQRLRVGASTDSPLFHRARRLLAEVLPLEEWEACPNEAFSARPGSCF